MYLHDCSSRSTANHITGKFSTESDPVNLEQYFKEYKNAIKTFEKDFCADFTFPADIESKTKPELANYNGQPATFTFVPERSNKEYHSLWKKTTKHTLKNFNLKTVSTSEHLLYPKYALTLFVDNKNSDKPNLHQKNKQIILSFRVYRPFLSDGRTEDIKLQQELLLLGNQTLKQLEELIECSLDYCGLEDLSSNLNLLDWNLIKKEKSRYPLAFFFINNTFYSNGSNIISNVPKTFLEQNGLGPFEEKGFSDKLQQISFQLGRPFVYQHIGQCEHLIVLSDARLQTENDPSVFPMVRSISGGYPRLCIICSVLYAKWLVVNCGKLPTARSFLCQRCFRSYCYIDNRKVDDFQAYQYLDPAIIL